MADVVVQERRKRAYRLFYGTVSGQTARTFTVRWLSPANLRAPATRWSNAQLKYMRVADANDFIHWFQNEEVTYWGRVRARVPTANRRAISLDVDWGDMEPHWGDAATNASLFART